MKLRIFVFSAIFVFLLCPHSFAFSPFETPYGADIYADGYQNKLNYSDTVGTTKAPVYGITIETYVTSIDGFDALANLPDWNYTTPGVPLTYLYYITSEANFGNYYNGNGRASYAAGGAAGFTGNGWSMTISTDAPATYTQYFTGISLPPNTFWGGDPTAYNYAGQTRRLWMTVTPSTLESQSPDGSFIAVTEEVSEQGGLGVPYGIYTGANGYSYGGYDGFIVPLDTLGDLTITCIHTSVMQMTRVVTIDSPTQYIAHANGQLGGDHSHDPVPGAVATFIITYISTGTAASQNVVIMDKVPASTEAAHVEAYKGSQAGLTNVTISANQPTAAPTWTSYYSTSASPGLGYGNLTGWVTINATLAPSSFATGSGIKYFKWEKSIVPTGEAKTLDWGVTIK